MSLEVFGFLRNEGVISWTSKKQNSIAPSTTEAQSIAMTQTTKELLCYRYY